MGVVNTTYTFTSTDTITSAKMNNIIDDTTFTSDAIQGTTLQVVSPGKLAVSASGITSNELASNAVVTAKIADSNITTAKIADANVTPAKLSNSDFGAFTVSSGVATLDDNSVTTSKITDASITAAKLNGAQTGTAPIYGCRAWVNFNGIGTTGTNMTIRASGNVSSVNKLGTGRYRVTFTTPMLDANYAAIVGGDANAPHKIPGVITQDTAYVDIGYSQINTSTARDDPDWGSVVIMR
jgi:uncharacterized protein YjbI with pentapeptide repeats